MENNEDIKEDLKEALDKSKELFNKSKKVLKNKLDESRNAFADYLDAGDENNVLKENSRLDNLLKRDPYQYMRLHGTERSFYKIKGVVMYKKNEKGKYEPVGKQSGSLVLTTRRLTFSVLSNRGAASTYIPIYGRFNSMEGKERDHIVYSIPNFILAGNLIKKGQFVKEWMPFQKEENMLHWEIERDGIVFDFVVDDDFHKKKNESFTNDLLSMKTEHLISTMIFTFRDTDFYPNWKWEFDYETSIPNMDKELENEERIDLIADLLDNYGYYWFLGKSKTKEEIEKILNKAEDKLESKSVEKIETKSVEKIETKSKDKTTKNNLDNKKNTDELKTSSLTDELEKLVSLKEKGLLTEEEFAAAKAKLLK